MGNTSRKTYQILLSSRKIKIQHGEVPLLAPMIEPSIGANNQPVLNISTAVVHASQLLRTPTMKEVIADTNAYNMGANRTPLVVNRTGIDGTTPDLSISLISSVAICSPTPSYG